MEYYKPFTPLNNKVFKSGILEKELDIFKVNDKEVINNRGIHGDKVYIDNGEVINIERISQTIVGILHLNTNQKYGFTKRNVPLYKFTAISNKYPNFVVPCRIKEKKAIYCIIRFNKWETSNKQPIGMIDKIIGIVGDLESETNMLLYHTKVFPKKNKVEYVEPEIIEDNIYHTYSIDPEGCLDIDDALHYLEKDDCIEIGIHIANVARFIKDININCYSSIYLQDKQINMLQDEVTYNKCSLGKDTCKKAISLILTIRDFLLIKSEFKETVLKNTPLSYKKADDIINSDQDHPIKKLHTFTKKLKNVTDLPSTKMVEHYMLTYNNLFAEKLYKHNNNTILRTHVVNHKDLNHEIKDKILDNYLHRISQNSAQYVSNPKNTYHEDLKLMYYTHATSPIRRYVDIINQFNMINIIENKEFMVLEDETIEKINIFQKNLRKFYNYYKKLKIIFDNKTIVTDAYIIAIKDIKIKIYIPELDINHGFLIISPKLLESNDIIREDTSIKVNNVNFSLYDKIRVSITPLPYEEKFNKKLHIKVLEPTFKIS